MSGTEGTRLEQLCLRLSAKDGPLATPGPMRELATRVAEQLRAGQSPSSLAADLDRLEDLLLQAGYAAGLSNIRSSYGNLPGLTRGRPVLEVLACPTELCTRVEAPASVTPTCPVLQRPLRRVVLGS